MAILNSNEIFFKKWEPKVAHRFLLQIDGIDAFLCKSVTAPNFTDQTITLDYINTYRKVRGKREWGDMSFTMYDPVTPSGAQQLMEWARLSYESVTGRAGYSDFYKKDLTFIALGPVGDYVSEWIIKGAFVTSSNFGSYDWSDGATAISIDVTIAMDYCVLNY